MFFTCYPADLQQTAWQLIMPLKTIIPLSYIYIFVSHLTENTVLLHYKKKYCCLGESLLYIVGIKSKMCGQNAEFYTVLQQVVQTYGYHWALNGCVSRELLPYL